ncbi:prolyl 3-hydroxylase OGFOD1-like [Branchiostoma floridae x Branchiostoma belcheri]
MSKRRKEGASGPQVKLAKSDNTQTQLQLPPPLHDGEITEKLQEAWSRSLDVETSCVTLQAKPFRHCIIKNYISEEFVAELETDLSQLAFNTKSNDLYSFKQTNDLKTVDSQSVGAFVKLLKEKMRNWLVEVTGIPLNDKVAITSSIYEHTDTLLCHDDELEERRIAFILYITPPSWTMADGGTLDLFSSSEGRLQPEKVVRSLVPTRSSLVFFEVTASSFHQVAEVLATDKRRLSMGGWFHGPPLARPALSPEPKVPLKPWTDGYFDMVEDWVNPLYFDDEVLAQIQQDFEDNSEILLEDFLKEDKVQMITAALQAKDLKWTETGPFNKRHYEQADSTSMPELVQQVTGMFQSEAMFLLLSRLTGLTLQSEGKNDEEEDSHGTPKCWGEVRRWRHRSYTLMHDEDPHNNDFCLDAMFYLSAQDWKSDYGGYVSYIAKGEDEELLTVVPKDNALALVYRDSDTLRFVKYINTTATDRQTSAQQDGSFYEVYNAYYE